MKFKYDLHIHTALSPCGADDMTPNNVVNMALINDLDIIAITDHNTCGNVEAVMKVARGMDLMVIPGIEVETREEIHVVCLFSEIHDVYNVQDVVFAHLPRRRNNTKIFGKQLLLNEEDDIIGEEARLLSFATDLSIDDLFNIVERHNGVMIPAHIDRPSYSVISNLGMIPENLKITTLEISRHSSLEEYAKKYPSYRLLQSSDAHDLGYIGIANQYLELDDISGDTVIKSLIKQLH